MSALKNAEEAEIGNTMLNQALFGWLSIQSDGEDQTSSATVSHHHHQ